MFSCELIVCCSTLSPPFVLAGSRYFMLPHYREEGVDATRYQSPASVSQTMPIRLVDYFVSAFSSSGFCRRGRYP